MNPGPIIISKCVAKSSGNLTGLSEVLFMVGRYEYSRARLIHMVNAWKNCTNYPSMRISEGEIIRPILYESHRGAQTAEDCGALWGTKFSIILKLLSFM